MFSVNQLYINKNNLDTFLKDNIVNFNSFFNSDYVVLESIKFEIEDVAITLENILNQLDYTKYYNSIFILTLLDYSEKLRLQSAYEVLYNIAILNNLSIGDRHKASKVYLLDINLKEDHFLKVDIILNLLENAYLTEEDNENAVLFTFGNYFFNAVLNTADVNVSIINKIISHIENVRTKYSFLSFNLIDEIIATQFDGYYSYKSKIKQLLKDYSVKQEYTVGANSFIIESNPNYSDLINNYTFSSIREISMVIFNKFSESQKTQFRYDLLRGVKIIDTEEQLYTYLTLYGKKHQTKLNIAFSYLPSLPPRYNIIDWACGQGLATMLFLDKYGTKSIQKIILNEPSELALKRASLHLIGYDKNIELTTIKKTISQLEINDISTKNNFANIHLFSNILDMELDLIHLTSLIEKACSGLNYFVCVSPFTPKDISRGRVDMFVHHFENKYGEKCKKLKFQDIQNGDPTMVLRVFEVHI